MLFDRALEHPPGQSARIIDVLFHIPYDGIDRSLSQTIASAPYDQVVTFRAIVESHQKPNRHRGPFRVTVSDESGDVSLVFFNAKAEQIERDLPVGAYKIISGKLVLFDGYRQITHPDRIMPGSAESELPRVDPVYALTEGLTARRVHNVARAALERLPHMPEWQNNSWLLQQKWQSFGISLSQLHCPQQIEDLKEGNDAHARLAYDELLAGQITLSLVRSRMKQAKGRSTIGNDLITSSIRKQLPYNLTGAQERALKEIESDLAAPERMLRLLQGDVGAGKTIIGLLTMARAVEVGRQAVMMAPTEILARQHYERISPIAVNAGIKTALLTGRMREKEKKSILTSLANGDIDICFGTHALFQEQVMFKDLAIAVVDEQHKFGVHQRLALGSKGSDVDLLVMTATPIPRTLVLTYFGDMDVSVLDEKPPGRKPIDTRALPIERLGEIINGLYRALEKSARIYWVCPLVSESEFLEDIAAVEERFETLNQVYPGKVGFVHGKLSGDEKEKAITDFVNGNISILVATTVIEVGVDVPQATIMVIEHAERFGLAQLHQLRGRIGRGAESSSCLLLYKGPLGGNAKARIEIMRDTEDGFRIAEEDLKLRGGGDVLGTRQSGDPGFRLARMSQHSALLPVARDDARLLLERDPHLASERGQAVRILLYLFERDAAIKLLRAG